jgi:glycosyltransferase involved in cell wall biosynthesis
MTKGRSSYRGFVVDLKCGAPYYLGELCSSLSKKGYPVRGVSPPFSLDPDYFEIMSPTATVGVMDLSSRIHLRPGRIRRLFVGFEYLWNLAAFTVRWLLRPPSFVHFQWLPLLRRSTIGSWIELSILRILRLRRIRIIQTVHNVLPHDTGDRHRAVFSKAYGLADSLIVHCEYARNELVRSFRIPDERIHSIPHGPLHTEVSREAPWPEAVPVSAPYVLFSGQIRPYKGLVFLIDAWPTVVESTPEAKLVIVGRVAGKGSSDYAASLKQQIERKQHSIIWMPEFVSKHELVSLHANAQVLVYPYRDITQSGALMTGLSFGKPVAATKVGGIVEVVRDGEQGFLVEYGDVGALAGSLNRLLNDAEMRSRMGRANSYRSQTDFSWDRIADLTISCYEAVTESETAKVEKQ